MSNKQELYCKIYIQTSTSFQELAVEVLGEGYGGLGKADWRGGMTLDNQDRPSLYQAPLAGSASFGNDFK